ncbi:MAG: glycerophosphodiester phosphodiesterase, partial [Candidatus Binataceae bacterium]
GAVRRIAPAVRVGLLASSGPTWMLAAATELGADAINPRADVVSEDLCAAAHQRNINVYTWTVDKPAMMGRLIAWGVDGIMTNYPERLRDMMGR